MAGELSGHPILVACNSTLQLLKVDVQSVSFLLNDHGQGQGLSRGVGARSGCRNHDGVAADWGAVVGGAAARQGEDHYQKQNTEDDAETAAAVFGSSGEEHAEDAETAEAFPERWRARSTGVCGSAGRSG